VWLPAIRQLLYCQTHEAAQQRQDDSGIVYRVARDSKLICNQDQASLQYKEGDTKLVASFQAKSLLLE
jgi:hypothetical protein